MLFLPERRFQLLALLALRAGEWVARDWIATLLWPERSNVQARTVAGETRNDLAISL